jgi:hypothetical protein
VARLALTCIPTSDSDAVSAFADAGAVRVSTYWVASTASIAASESEPTPHRPDDVTRPCHTFGGQAFDPGAPGALAFTTDAGSMVGTPSITAPPVYDPGGTVTVVDHVKGADLLETLRTGLAVASERGDVLLTVICDADNADLAAALDESGFERTVEVYAFPQA